MPEKSWATPLGRIYSAQGAAMATVLCPPISVCRLADATRRSHCGDRSAAVYRCHRVLDSMAPETTRTAVQDRNVACLLALTIRNARRRSDRGCCDRFLTRAVCHAGQYRADAARPVPQA